MALSIIAESSDLQQRLDKTYAHFSGKLRRMQEKVKQILRVMEVKLGNLLRERYKS